jgi:crossover junction endodeoxyribonuclease RusA
MSFTARLPLPSLALSPNARVHWAVKSRAAKAYRIACAWAFKCAMPTGWKPVPVEIDIEYRAHKGCGGYRPLDPDNAAASCKSAIDAMKDAGVIVNDSRKFLHWTRFSLLTTRPEVDKAGGPGVFITVRAKP